MFVSMGIRVLVNVEALNMVEAIGNVTRHRTIPYVHRRGGKYVITWVPALSGECLAHAYQSHLADLAIERGINVCYWCRAKEFVKHFDLKFWKNTARQINYASDEIEIANKYADTSKLALNQMKEIEEKIVKICAVEDVCGFLVTQGPVKRTSRVMFSYVVPTMESVESGAVAIDNQFFVRHAPQAESFRGEMMEPIQAPYYVQTASAIYGFTVAIDLDSIGVSSIDGSKIVSEEEMARRRRLALDALKEMLDSRVFGAKLSRFTPMLDYEIMIAMVSGKIKMMVSPPVLKLREFIEDNIVRAAKACADVGDYVKVLIWCRQGDIAKLVDEVIETAKSKDIDVKSFIEKGFVKKVVSPSVRDLFNELYAEIGLRGR